jgi:hypothetical protein
LGEFPNFAGGFDEQEVFHGVCPLAPKFGGIRGGVGVHVKPYCILTVLDCTTLFGIRTMISEIAYLIHPSIGYINIAAKYVDRNSSRNCLTSEVEASSE